MKLFDICYSLYEDFIMTRGIFITATGTDVGKTYVSALLVKKLRDNGINCGYYKPVLSGAEVHEGRLYPGDCEYVKKIAGLDGEAIQYSSYIFKPAVSPHLASIMEDNPISLDKIKYDFEKLKSKFDYVVVEGAGGITCPMNLAGTNHFLIGDIIKGLDLSVVFVSDAKLGSINYALLTSEYAKNNGIKVNGIILNRFNSSDFMQLDNKKQIESLCNTNIIATVNDDANELICDLDSILSIFEEI